MMDGLQIQRVHYIKTKVMVYCSGQETKLTDSLTFKENIDQIEQTQFTPTLWQVKEVPH